MANIYAFKLLEKERLRHIYLVHLLGYCRWKGELVLVYNYMPDGSLDKFLFEPTTTTLNWLQRFKILRGVASRILYTSTRNGS
ncbi:L-type lectin-domain containing receptor kinase SIT2 [Linum perenne]